jgi:hypothetical protein
MGELEVSMFYTAFMQAMHASLKYKQVKLSQLNKSNENDYPIDDTEIVAGDSLTPEQAKLAHLVVMIGYDGWIWPKICTKEKVTKCKQ